MKLEVKHVHIVQTRDLVLRQQGWGRREDDGAMAGISIIRKCSVDETRFVWHERQRRRAGVMGAQSSFYQGMVGVTYGLHRSPAAHGGADTYEVISNFAFPTGVLFYHHSGTTNQMMKI